MVTKLNNLNDVLYAIQNPTSKLGSGINPIQESHYFIDDSPVDFYIRLEDTDEIIDLSKCENVNDKIVEISNRRHYCYFPLDAKNDIIKVVCESWTKQTGLIVYPSLSGIYTMIDRVEKRIIHRSHNFVGYSIVRLTQNQVTVTKPERIEWNTGNVLSIVTKSNSIKIHQVTGPQIVLLFSIYV